MPDITITLSDEEIRKAANSPGPNIAMKGKFIAACRQWVEDNKPVPEVPPIGSVVTDRYGARWSQRRNGKWGYPGTIGLEWLELNKHYGPLTIVEPDPYLDRPWGRHAADPVPGDKDYEPKSRVREMIDVIEEQMDDDPPQRTEYRISHGVTGFGTVIKAADLAEGDRLVGGVVEKITRVESDGYICAYAGSTTLWSGWPNTLIVLEES